MADKKDRFIPVGLYRELLTKELKPGHLLVLLVIISYGKDGELIYPSVARIAYDTNYSEKNIPNILKGLEDIGVLIRVGKTKFGTIIYKIDLDVLDYKPQFVSKRQKLRNQFQLDEMKQIEPEESCDYFI